MTQGCVATPKYNRAQSSVDRIGSTKAEEHRGSCHRSENSILFRILWDAHLMSSCSRFGYPVLKRCSRREKQQTMFDLPREIVYRRELVSISTRATSSEHSRVLTFERNVRDREVAKGQTRKV